MIWTEQSLQPGCWTCRRFGPLTVLLLNHHEEWQLCHWLNDAPVAPGDGVVEDLPDDLPWQRWDCTDQDDKFQIRPAFPELPLIAQPTSPLWLAPGGQAQFFVGIPALLEVRASFDGQMRSLTRITTQALTKTWHGDRSQGNPAFTLRTRARRLFGSGVWPEHDIICAVDIVNEGDEDFHFEKLYIETGHLGIFEHENQLWSNACRIRIADPQVKIHDVTFAPRPLSPADQATEIHPPEDGHSRRGKFTRAFSSFIDSLTD